MACHPLVLREPCATVSWPSPGWPLNGEVPTMRSLLAALLNKWKTKRTREPMPPKSRFYARRLPLYLEQLEDRTVPATAIWQGTGDGSSWSDPHNWSTNAVPGSADDVVI